MILLQLFLEFFRAGLFAVGGALATIPFLEDIGVRTGWFTSADLANMLAISESTPGPIGVNMATYVGFTCAGVPGAILATLGLLTPALIVMLLISVFLRRFWERRAVQGVFSGLRPASLALITSAGISVAGAALFYEGVMWTGWQSLAGLVNWKALLLAAAVFILIRFTPLKKLHPIAFIACSAVLGAVFQF